MDKKDLFLVICFNRHDMDICSIDSFQDYESAAKFLEEDYRKVIAETSEICECWCEDGEAVIKAVEDKSAYGCEYTWKWQIQSLTTDTTPKEQVA